MTQYIEKLLAALKPFAKLAAKNEPKLDKDLGLMLPTDEALTSEWIRVGDLRRAAEAYASLSAAVGEGVWVPAEKLREMQERIDTIKGLQDKSAELNERIIEGVKLLSQPGMATGLTSPDGWRARPIKPDDKAILVKLKSPCLNMEDGEFLVLNKWSNGNWHSSGSEVYIVGEDFENLVWPLPASPGSSKPLIVTDAMIEAAAKVDHEEWRKSSMQFRSDPTPLPTWDGCDPEFKQYFRDRAKLIIAAALSPAAPEQGQKT